MLVVELGGTFEQTRVQIEDAEQQSAKDDAEEILSASYLLSRVGLTPWWSTEQ